MIRNIPEELLSEESLLHYFNRLYPDRVQSVYIVPDLRTLEKLVKKREKARKKYHNAVYKYEKSGLLPVHRHSKGTFLGKLRGPTMPSVEYFQKKIDDLDQKIQREKERPHANTRVGFVTFDKIATAVQASQTLHRTDPFKLQVSPAPDPHAIMWKWLHIPNFDRLLRTAICVLALILLFLFWSIPVTFISALSNIESLSKVPGLKFLVDLLEYSPFISSLLGDFLPALALIIFMALLPKILRAILSIRGWYVRRGLDKAVMSAYWLFLLLNVFLVVTISGSLFNSLFQLLENPVSISAILAQSLPEQAIFFTNYIILQTGLFALIWFARAWDWIEWRIKIAGESPLSRDAITPAVMKDFFAQQYSKELLIFTIGLIYSSMAPIVLPFSMLYFAITFVCEKYSWVYVYHPNYEGTRMSRKVINRIFVALFLYQATLLGALGLTLFPYAMSIIILVVFTFGYRVFLERRFHKPSRYLALENCPPDNTEVLEQAQGKESSPLYVHPALKLLPSLDDPLDKRPLDDDSPYQLSSDFGRIRSWISERRSKLRAHHVNSSV